MFPGSTLLATPSTGLVSDPPVRARPRGIRKSKLNVGSELSGRVGALEEELLAPDAGCRRATQSEAGRRKRM